MIKDVLNNRRSYRNFNGEKVDSKILEETLAVAQRTACSVNGQQISAIIVDDEQKIKEIAEVNWSQEHIYKAAALIVFVADYNRAQKVIEVNDAQMVHHNHIESILVSGVDAGLMAQSVELMLQEQEIATCFLGGIRNDMPRVSKILNIEGIAFPIIALAVGQVNTFINDPKRLRPRVPKDSFIFNNEYDYQKVKEGAIEYDKVLNEWWESLGQASHRSYQESMTQFYSKYYIDNGFRQLQELGFLKLYNEEK